MSVGNPAMSRSQETRYRTWPSLILTMKWSLLSLTHTQFHFRTLFTKTIPLSVLFLARSLFPLFPSPSGCSSSNGVCRGSSRNDHYHPRITGRGLHTVDSDERGKGNERGEEVKRAKKEKRWQQERCVISCSWYNEENCRVFVMTEDF